VNVARTRVAAAALGVIIAWLSACGPSAREKTISTTLTATDVAAHAFIAYDAKKQADIVAAAPDKATGAAQLATWRAEQTKVAQLLAGTYRAVAVAATVNDDQSLAAMAQAALIVSQELHALGAIP